MLWHFWRHQAAQTSAAEAPSQEAVVEDKRASSASRYTRPADVAEEERLNLQHVFYKVALGGNTCVPLRAPGMILDVACGTGIWGREMAQEFPQAEVWGFDINLGPLERAERRLQSLGKYPQNFRYLQANALERFPFEDAQFDLTHVRLLSTWLPIAQYQQVIEEMLRVTRPTGYLELVDFEMPTTASSAATELIQAARRLLEERGLHCGAAPHLVDYLCQANVRRLREHRVIGGSGRQATREQRLLIADFLAALRAMQPGLVSAGMLSESACAELIRQAEIELPKVGMICPIVSAYGVRPLEVVK